MAKRRQSLIDFDRLLGKRIVSVETSTFDSTEYRGTQDQQLQALTLDDGSRLVLTTGFKGRTPYVRPVYTKGPGKGRRKMKPPKPPV